MRERDGVCRILMFCQSSVVLLHHLHKGLRTSYRNAQFGLLWICENIGEARIVNSTNNKKAVLSQRWAHIARYISGSNEPLRRYGRLKLSKMAACCQLGFDVTRNSAIRSADPENPTLEPNMKCIGSPVVEIWPFAYLGGAWNHHFRGKGRS